MTRLARHDEIVERMAQAIFDIGLDSTYRAQGAAALDALLTAVVELGVGTQTEVMAGFDRGTDSPIFRRALIIQLEDKP